VSRRGEQKPTEPIEDLRRENARLRRDLERSEAERARFERERARLEWENARLKEELEAARRAGARQAAPFSKGAPKRRPRRPGRKSGAAYGRRGQRAVPTVVRENHDVPIPQTCPDCGGRVCETHVAAHIKGICRRSPDRAPLGRPCRRVCRLPPPSPRPASAADIGFARRRRGATGPLAIALSVLLNKQFGLSFGNMAALFRARFALHVASSALVRALHRTAAHRPPTHTALCETARTTRNLDSRVSL
jgi:transposase